MKFQRRASANGSLWLAGATRQPNPWFALEKTVQSIDRRRFLKESMGSVAAVAATAPAVTSRVAKASANDAINIAVVGVRNRGKAHIRACSKLLNVNIAAICDIDERLWAPTVAEIQKLSGRTPKTYFDFRKLLEDKSINAVSLATPDHWHAMQTVWACQAGKDVYVEKPMSWCLEEGKKAVEAARKYSRVVQVGAQYRSNAMTQEAVKLVQQGKLGKIYMTKVFYYGYRDSIGHKPDSAIPNGVHWDLFLGPAPYRPFNVNRFHYNWHWFWETGNSDLTANGIHFVDIARWATGKREAPVRIHSDGGYYVFDSDQETPNMIYASCEYADKTMFRFEIHNLSTPFLIPETGAEPTKVGLQLFGSEGWMLIGPSEFRVYSGKANKRELWKTAKEIAPDPMDRQGSGEGPHFKNFIDCVRSRKWQDLNSDVQEGQQSVAICHLAEIAYRTQRVLTFDPATAKFPGDEEANAYLTRRYRAPYVMPENV
jgi:predicted dehydrogenase